MFVCFIFATLQGNRKRFHFEITYLGRQVILRSKKVLWCSDVSWRETMPEKTLPQFPQVLSIFAKLIFKACCRFNEWQHSLLNPDNILRLTSKLRWAFIWYLYVPPQRCYINKRRLALLFRSCNEQFCLSVLPAFFVQEIRNEHEKPEMKNFHCKINSIIKGWQHCITDTKTKHLISWGIFK